MIVRVAALILFFSTTAFFPSAKASHLISLSLVDVGDNITFECIASEKEVKFVSWYKQSLGYMVETVASVVLGQLTISEKFKGSRFAMTTKWPCYDLTIFNISKEDEATYYCHIGTSYSQKFINATFLAVKDDKHQKSLYLEQHPKTELVQQGETVNLQCSLLSKSKEKSQCPTKSSMYWFRTESERFHTGIIYTQRNISDKDLARSCSYSLSVRDSSDAGIYYSAVVACGSIVIDEGTKVEMRKYSNLLVVGLGGLLALCVSVIFLLIFNNKDKNICQHLKGELSVLMYTGNANQSDSNEMKNETTEAKYTVKRRK